MIFVELSGINMDKEIKALDLSTSILELSIFPMEWSTPFVDMSIVSVG
jgi:hypothetical protein